MKLVTSVAIAIVAAFSGHAATLTVTNTADTGAGSLRATIASAAAGDTIQFDPSLNGQTITLTSGEILLNKVLTISGPGAAQLAISGNNSSRIFRTTTDVTLGGLTLENGLNNSGGALEVQNSHGVVSDCAFVDNAAPNGIGGAVYNPNSPMEFTNCTFTGNSSSGFGVGGAFFGSQPIPVTMTDCTFNQNSAHDGGAIFTDAPLTLVRCKFTGNSIPSDGIGGAIFNDYPTDISTRTFFGQQHRRRRRRRRPFP